jgi:DNA mismatch repair protein MutL
MSFGIRALPKEVVNLIAAGEVIDSLAAVVRELVENALDAGATRIVVSVCPDQWRVRVADNGMGMGLGDLQQAATAHSTSKIRTSDDLWKITSLGFRGEALHSLVALAELEILSRRTPNVEGWRVRYNSQGEPMQVEACAIAPGTVVTVSNLFGIGLCAAGLTVSGTTTQSDTNDDFSKLPCAIPVLPGKCSKMSVPGLASVPVTTTQHILPQILRQVAPDGLAVSQRGSPDAGDWGRGRFTCAKS